MKRLFVVLSLAFGILLVAPAPEASAWGGWSSSSNSQQHRARRHHQHRRSGKTVKTETGVPELDPGAAGSALVLLFGGIAYIASRRREDGLA
jgi:hypothetical protein